MLIPKLAVRPIFQWHELLKFRRWNWINFALCDLSFEAGTYKGCYVEIYAVVLGVGVEISIVGRMSRALFMADMDQRVAEAKDALGIEDESP